MARFLFGKKYSEALFPRRGNEVEFDAKIINFSDGKEEKVSVFLFEKFE